MKMLGQDLHTQEEFNQFYEQEFSVLSKKVELINEQQQEIEQQMRQRLRTMASISVISLITALSALAYSLVQFAPK